MSVPFQYTLLVHDVMTKIFVVILELKITAVVYCRLYRCRPHRSKKRRNGPHRCRPHQCQKRHITHPHDGWYTWCHQLLQWRHNGCDGIWNHQPHNCWLNHLFRHRLKKTSKLRVTGVCGGNSPVTSEFPAQIASYAENVSIWWRLQESCNWFQYKLCTYN